MGRGVFGAEVSGEGVERIDPSVAADLLSGAAGEAPAARADGAAVIAFDVRADGSVQYAREATSAAPIASLADDRARLLGSLARACACLRAIHAESAAHGALAPDLLRVTTDGTVLVLAPSRAFSPGALLAARLRAGCPPEEVAYAAPEVVTRFSAGPAADAYAIGAITHRLLSGAPPLGLVDFAPAKSGSLAPLAAIVERALAPDPATRPRLDVLERALRDAATTMEAMDRAAAAAPPYRSGVPHVPPDPAGSKPASSAEARAHRATASSMSGILALLLLVGGAFVFVGAIWLIAESWSTLGAAGRFVLLVAITGGILAGGSAAERRGYARSGAALVILAMELLWADGAYMLHLGDRLDSSGAWSVLAFGLTAIAFALAGVRRSAACGALAAVHYAVFAGCFGDFISTGTKTGPATYSLAVAAVAALLAWAGHAWREVRLGGPFAVCAALGACASALAGYALLFGEDLHVFATLWPYAVLACASILYALVPAPYRVIAALLAWSLLSGAPAGEALARYETLGHYAASIAIGFAVIAGAFRSPLARAPMSAAWVLSGLAGVCVPAFVCFAARCLDRSFADTLASGRAVYVLALLGTSALLIGLSYAFAEPGSAKKEHRLLEAAALVQLFGAFVLASLARIDEWAYPGLVAITGATVLTLGSLTKRAALVLLASSALLVELVIQYFAKLRNTFPASALAIGFGIALLGGAVLYERALKRRLSLLRAWD